MLEQKKSCDGCRKILKSEDENQSYFTFKNGSITVSKYLEKTDRYSEINITNAKTEHGMYDFCDVGCFADWVDLRVLQQRAGLYNSYLEAKKKDPKIMPENYFLDDEDVKEVKKYLSKKT